MRWRLWQRDHGLTVERGGRSVKKYTLATAVAAVVVAGLVPGIALAGTGGPPAAKAPAVPTCADVASIRLAADHWISGHANPGDSTWFNSLFIKGDIEAYRLTTDTRYLNYATGWANKNKWKLPTNAPNYDGPEASQEYIDLWELDPKHPASDIADTQAYLTRQTKRVQGGKVNDLNYVDAVPLGAMSAFARLSPLNKSQAQLDAMAKMFAYTESHIYDKKNSLWWRDSRWVGTTQHWSRGNRWIVLALTDTNAAPPDGDANRAHYISLLNAMFARLRPASRPAGTGRRNSAPPPPSPPPGPTET